MGIAQRPERRRLFLGAVLFATLLGMTPLVRDEVMCVINFSLGQLHLHRRKPFEAYDYFVRAERSTILGVKSHLYAARAMQLQTCTIDHQRVAKRHLDEASKMDPGVCESELYKLVEENLKNFN